MVKRRQPSQPNFLWDSRLNRFIPMNRSARKRWLGGEYVPPILYPLVKISDGEYARENGMKFNVLYDNSLVERLKRKRY